MYDWLVVGGGPHGRFIAGAIMRAAPGARLAVIDPQRALAAWRRRAEACGMAFLRSTSVHHLGARADGLRRFAAAHGYDAAHALGYYRRPSRALFEAHAAAELPAIERMAASARRIAPIGGGWRVALADGRVRCARRVVLATGPGAPYRPPGLAAAEHVFDPDFVLGARGRTTAVVGGGITGAQLALRAARAGHPICWLTSRAPRVAPFDAEPCYAGPLCLRPFARAEPAERRRLLAQARRPGTLPSDVHTAISAAMAQGVLAGRRATPVAETKRGLKLADGGELTAERVILATGFERRPAADSVLGRLIADHRIAIDSAGHLPLNEALEALAGLHVAGRPASLQLGPMAGNLKGARLAGQRLAPLAAAEDRRTACPA